MLKKKIKEIFVLVLFSIFILVLLNNNINGNSIIYDKIILDKIFIENNKVEISFSIFNLFFFIILKVYNENSVFIPADIEKQIFSLISKNDIMNFIKENEINKILDEYFNYINNSGDNVDNSKIINFITNYYYFLNYEIYEHISLKYHISKIDKKIYEKFCNEYYDKIITIINITSNLFYYSFGGKDKLLYYINNFYKTLNLHSDCYIFVSLSLEINDNKNESIFFKSCFMKFPYLFREPLIDKDFSLEFIRNFEGNYIFFNDFGEIYNNIDLGGVKDPYYFPIFTLSHEFFHFFQFEGCIYNLNFDGLEVRYSIFFNKLFSLYKQNYSIYILTNFYFYKMYYLYKFKKYQKIINTIKNPISIFDDDNYDIIYDFIIQSSFLELTANLYSYWYLINIYGKSIETIKSDEIFVMLNLIYSNLYLSSIMKIKECKKLNDYLIWNNIFIEFLNHYKDFLKNIILLSKNIIK
ncbi:MAG: hypothetical protein NUV32_10470 [Exilispira sp.]|jgi:hypothetical protein|nr:hypothetical protein [Exilispira sp.]